MKIPNKINLNITLLKFILFILGTFINVISYRSIGSIFVILFFLLLSKIILFLTNLNSKEDNNSFLLFFVSFWFISGIGSFIDFYISLDLYLETDGFEFFQLATENIKGLSLQDITLFSNGPLAIFSWRFFYDFFENIGFSKQQYIGILVNIFLVSLSGVITLRLVKLLYSESIIRIKLTKLLFVTCGLFWIYAAIHLRDAFALIIIASLNYSWVRLFKNVTLYNFIALIVTSLLSYFSLLVIREQYSMIPIIFIFLGFFSKFMFSNLSKFKVIIFSLLSFLLLGNILYLNYDVFETIIYTNDIYKDLSSLESNSGSLGSLIINFPLPFNLIFGFIYLLIFPIPFWTGLNLESSYHLFKSFNVIYIYFTLPLFIISNFFILKNKSERNPSVIFILLQFYILTLLIVGTSMDNRHLGTFMIAYISICVLPNLQIVSVKKNYNYILTIVLSLILLVHLLWLIYKFLI